MTMICDKYADTLGKVLGIGLCLIFISSCIIIIILIVADITTCKVELGLGLGLSSGIIMLIVYIFAVILLHCSCLDFEGKVEFGKGILCIFYFIYHKCTKDEKNPEESDDTKHENSPRKPDEVPPVETYVGTDAKFSFMVTEDYKESEVLIKNESGCVVKIVSGIMHASTNPLYKDRVALTGNMKPKMISFTLKNVTPADAGTYSAEISDAKIIIGCQKLIVKVKKSKTNNSGSSAVSREHVLVQMEMRGFKGDEEERTFSWSQCLHCNIPLYMDKWHSSLGLSNGVTVQHHWQISPTDSNPGKYPQQTTLQANIPNRQHSWQISQKTTLLANIPNRQHSRQISPTDNTPGKYTQQTTLQANIPNRQHYWQISQQTTLLANIPKQTTLQANIPNRQPSRQIYPTDNTPDKYPNRQHY
ncbi:hypothetical protein ACJMK2_008804 [Sinanodonta woodiana]|uniref:Uncharacterized protein n=1 Tax=Sinanodonta woodiana TaxID=1069815 RepID=A0ABD3VQP2_SINWO